MRRSVRRSYGFALTEVIVAGTLLLLVVQVAWWVAAVQSVVATRVVAGARMLDETRLIHHLLSTEVGHGESGADWSVNGRELQLRAFRGVGFTCRTQPTSGWGVAVAGYRRSDSDKDSVLVLSDDGRWRTSSLERTSRRRTLDCQELDGFSTEIWFLDPPRPRGVAALYFENGAYRFSDDGVAPVWRTPFHLGEPKEVSHGWEEARAVSARVQGTDRRAGEGGS